MKRLALAAPVIAALFAGCSSPGPSSPASTAIKPIEHPYWAGSGVVQAVTPTPATVVAGPNPSARSPAATAESGMQRLRIRMDDGRTMWVDTPSRDFQPGTRVQLTATNEIHRQ